MKKNNINSSLFDSAVLQEQMDTVRGGALGYTSKHDDTNMSSGSYDIFFGTTDKEGKNSEIDTYDSGKTTLDQPY